MHYKRVRALIVRDGCVLLIYRVKDRHQYWVFPGGGVESIDEDDRAALERECLEELSLSVECAPVPYLTVGYEAFYACIVVG
jgi:8-oxo-dGTP pyrophosphatase MutT (NUDIX family)